MEFGHCNGVIWRDLINVMGQERSRRRILLRISYDYEEPLNSIFEQITYGKHIYLVILYNFIDNGERRRRSSHIR